MDIDQSDIDEANDALMMSDTDGPTPTPPVPAHSTPASRSTSPTASEQRWDPTPPDSPAPTAAAFDSGYVQRPVQASDVDAAVARLFLSEEYADIRIVVKGGGEGGEGNGDGGNEERVYPAHKNIVCTQCEFFELCCRSGFREAQTNTITITDESPKTIYRLLSYLYLKSYSDQPTSWRDRHNESDHTGQFHHSTYINFSMYRLAQKYGVPGLARHAVEKHFTRLDDVNLLTEHCWAAKLAYETFEGRWDAMRRVHVVHVGDLMSSSGPGRLARDGVSEVGERWGEFAVDVLEWVLWCGKNGGRVGRELMFKDGRGGLTLEFGKRKGRFMTASTRMAAMMMGEVMAEPLEEGIGPYE
ncbi:hypothetical protein BJ508DRAFT_381801 [Ascobolus immersus RN42]|uniref:BTB domain-containing protein n=1 Tax=Ascobolus immersus RN42 TaxID=1160509 RepID=A0A3N4HEE1_ASCIM|nr:hypothetical protein BJ508DRAFT_381801 [Ascobolus immersus RN42]